MFTYLFFRSGCSDLRLLCFNSGCFEVSECFELCRCFEVSECFEVSWCFDISSFYCGLLEDAIVMLITMLCITHVLEQKWNKFCLYQSDSKKPLLTLVSGILLLLCRQNLDT